MVEYLVVTTIIILGVILALVWGSRHDTSDRTSKPERVRKPVPKVRVVHQDAYARCYRYQDTGFGPSFSCVAVEG